MRLNLPFKNKEGYYIQQYPLRWFSLRYLRYLSVPIGYPMDGASGPAIDIHSEAWPLHDRATPELDKAKWPACACGFWETDGFWDDGTPISVWQGSWILHDKLLEEGRWFRARTWWAATLVAGWWRTLRRKYGERNTENGKGSGVRVQGSGNGNPGTENGRQNGERVSRQCHE